MRNGKHESNSPSRFLREIDSQYIANPIVKEDEVGESESRWPSERSMSSGFRSSSFGSRPMSSGARPTQSGVRPGQSSSRLGSSVSRPVTSTPRPAISQPVRRPQPVQPRVSDADFEPTPIVQLKAGQRIEHNRFGFGKILEITGPITDLKAKISFDDHGDKILILKYAKIRVVSQ